MTKQLAVATTVILALGLAGSAGAATPRIHRHQVRQQERIAQGVRSGSLTPRETMRLERGQMRVSRELHRARRDGVVTPRERARVLREQRVQGRRIWRMKHNQRSR
jgi:hypothetical protein